MAPEANGNSETRLASMQRRILNRTFISLLVLAFIVMTAVMDGLNKAVDLKRKLSEGPADQAPQNPVDPSSSTDQNGTGDGGVIIQPKLGPVGTVIDVSGAPCPPVPEGKRPKAVRIGISRNKIPLATRDLPLVPGEPWSGAVTVPESTEPGPIYAWSICFAVDPPDTTWQRFRGFDSAEFQVTSR